MLTDKIAIVTGAGSGLGEATSLLFAKNGATVLLADLDVDGAQRVLRQIEQGGGKGRVVETDVSKPEHAEDLVEVAMKEYGRLDVAVNNAGIGGPTAPVGEYPIDGWERIIGINLSGVFYGMRYQIPAMLESGGGAVVNMASVAGKVGLVNASGYAAAKHGVVGLTETAAIEYGARGIRVNAVGPGFIKTPLLGKRSVLDAANADGNAEMQALAALHPMNRLGEPEEVAELVLFLASDRVVHHRRVLQRRRRLPRAVAQCSTRRLPSRSDGSRRPLYAHRSSPSQSLATHRLRSATRLPIRLGSRAPAQAIL